MSLSYNFPARGCFDPVQVQAFENKRGGAIRINFKGDFGDDFAAIIEGADLRHLRGMIDAVLSDCDSNRPEADE